MFSPKDFFKGKTGREELTSLKLETPAKPLITPPASPVADLMQKTAAALKDSPVPRELGRLAKELVDSGQRPKLICFLRDANQNPMALLLKEPNRRAVLIFSSPVLAHFFVRTKGMPFEVGGVALEEFEATAEDWQRRGFDSFVLDLSPKAPTFNVVSAQDGRISRDQVVFAWAMGRTTRNWQARTRLAEFYGKREDLSAFTETLVKQRAALEVLRDYGSFDVPFVHWMIALIAGMQKDEEARAAATAVLESFGPDFVGRTARMEGERGMKEWFDSMALAQIGLLAEFGMLKGPDGLPMKSLLRSESRTTSPVSD